MQIKILVVDDSAFDRLIIKSMLSEYSILTACDGLEAMRVLEEVNGIDLLILDLNMPNMNGFQLLEALRGDERFRRLRTIILTNYDELENEIKGLRLGAVDYIRKPIHMDSLKVRIDVHAALLRAQDALERRLDEQTYSLDMILEQAPIGIAITRGGDPERPEGVLVRANSVYEEITGRTMEELAELGWVAITHPDDVKEDLDNLQRLQAGEIRNYSMDKRYIRPDGSVVWVHMIVAAMTPQPNSEMSHICLVQDVSDRKQMEMERKYISEHDRWTGLYNRNYLESLLKRDAILERQSKRALIGINLSMVQLLAVNYGFQYTQGLIKKAAEVLNQFSTDSRLLFHARENRSVFYWYDYKDKRELVNFAETIADTLESLFVTDRIGGGIGILEIGQSQHEADVDLILRKLLIASEKHVNASRNDFQVCVYDEELEATVNRETYIVEALNAAVADDHAKAELYLQYQPIVDLRTNAISSFEALARLWTAELGPVPPAEFIPIAEKTKLILPIGEKVILKAFSFLNKLKARGYGRIGIAINVSAIQLLKPDFASWLLGAMRERQIDSNNVGIEITESVFASDCKGINSMTKELRDAGLHIAIDDFGTGYSSLSRAKELRIDCMKIAKQFVDKLMGTNLKRAITGDIISMSHKLGHCTIAEGVEHDIQLQYLKEHDCDKVQGYLISRPLDEEDAIRFASEHGAI
jgi:PAS domain S-box-containing protein